MTGAMVEACHSVERKVQAMIDEHGAPNLFYLTAEVGLTRMERESVRYRAESGDHIGFVGGIAHFEKVGGKWCAVVSAEPTS